MAVLTTPGTGADRTAVRPRASTGRDGFLDTVRAISILRVVLWHAFGYAAITYVVSAVPAMFFVTGSLLAQSIDRKGATATLRDRMRRLLLPFWAFGVFAVGVMVAADVFLTGPDTAVPWTRMIWWLFPLADPAGSPWQAGWLNDPLWYLRCMVWVLLAAPVLVAFARRYRAASIVVPILAVVVLDVVGRDPSWLPADAERLPWLLGDFALYGGFAMLGVAHRDGVLGGLSRRLWCHLAALCGGSAALWVLSQPVPGYVVNNSHPAHLFVGGAWLCLAFVARGWLAGLASRPRLGRIVTVVNQRSLTIYLWHSATIITAYQLLWRVTDPKLSEALFDLLLLGLVAAMTTTAVLLFGWIEDVAGRRAPRLWPVAPMATVRARRAPVVVGVAGIAAVVVAGCALDVPERLRTFVGETPATTVASVGNTAPDGGTGPVVATTPARRKPPAPSQQPPTPSFTSSASTVARTVTSRAPAVVTAAAVSSTPTAVPASTARTPPAAPSAGAAPVAAPLPTLAADAELAPPVDAALGASLRKALATWTGSLELPGASFGLLRPGQFVWIDAVGTDLDGRPWSPTSTFGINSITKTFTSALVMREVAAGRLALDAPLPALRALPDFPYGSDLTVRQLLDHSSGLVNFREAPGYRNDAVVTPFDAVRLSATEPLLFTPGSRHEYSSSGYLVLGFLLEQVTGRPFDDLLGEVLRAAGMTASVHLGPEVNEPNFATSGIVTDVDDLLRWGTVHLRDRAVVPQPLWPDYYSAIDAGTLLGPVWGFCPCSVGEDGALRWSAIGHAGGSTMLAYSEDDDLVAVLQLPTGLWETPQRYAQAEGFIDTIRSLVHAATSR
ncbi:MAG: serine hydrolase [Acidimicrobiales bacterium]